MLFEKIKNTITLTILVGVFAVIADYTISVIVLKDPYLFNIIKTLLNSSIVCVPVGYYLINHPMNLQIIKERRWGKSIPISIDRAGLWIFRRGAGEAG